MKDELHDTAMREFKEYGRDTRLTWKDWAALLAVNVFIYWLITAVRG